jgi:tetratricopeptide (TPR) repeat protein
VVTELALRDADIAFYAKRAVEDPWSAADRAQLAGLWLQRGRESGDPADFRRAEQLARASLSLRESRNARTRLVLASSLLAQHRFTEALEVAEDLVRDEPEIVGYRALLAEIALELGRYEEAAAQFDTLYHARRDLAVAPRLARWAELRGDRAHARRILEAALETARSRSDLPREQLAWFHLRVADLALRHGRLRDAERALRDGLVGEPGDTRLVAALARVAAARGRWREAIRLVELAADRADLAALALAGDAAAALGDTATAERWYAAVEHRAAENPEPFNRQWTQFRVDHARRLPETIALLLDEVRVRPDVLGWDLLSWALYQGGAYSEARSAIRQAVRLGTQDALLYFHAGMIEHRLGRADSARALLEHALRLNPRFHHFYADTARAMLRATR